MYTLNIAVADTTTNSCVPAVTTVGSSNDTVPKVTLWTDENFTGVSF